MIAVPIRLVTDSTAAAAAEVEEALYEVRRKIYPRAVAGAHARWRWAIMLATQVVFYGLPWLQWNNRQAVLFDLAARKFYIFGMVMWPQDVIYLTVLLVIAALSLFLFTAVAGRLWCGYACPQTVYTELFLWVERQFEGDRMARIRLDAGPLTVEKFARKSAKHSAWFLMALWTGFTFVGFFSPIRSLLPEFATLRAGSWETFWVLFYGFATYGNAGWMREQVCKHMCPYARFQSVMFDRDTLLVTYDTERGDPRGARGRKADPRSMGLGDCVDCGICVQVCPTGIDIRNGLQYECIGCTACIDGCNAVMDKMGYARGLIRYDTANGLAQHLTFGQKLRRTFRLRTAIYSTILLAILTALVVSLVLHQPLKVDVLRDRGVLAREVAPGVIENVYRLQIMNTDEAVHRFRIDVTGLADSAIAGIDGPVEVVAATTRMLPLRVRHSGAGSDLAPGTYPIRFTIADIDNAGRQVVEKSTFIIPR